MRVSKLLSQISRYTNYFLLVIITILIFLILITFPYQENAEVIKFTAEAPFPVNAERYKVEITGAIKNPGVYEVNKDTRVVEVINLAGGFDSNADPVKIAETINLVEKISDGQKIKIPFITQQNSSTSSLVNINNASKEELMNLPGVGESTAQKIIDNRPYGQIEDLLNVPGIGEAKFEELKNLIGV